MADSSTSSVILLEQKHDLLCNVRRSAILCENGIQTYTLYKYWKDFVSQKPFIAFTVYKSLKYIMSNTPTVQVVGLKGPISSKYNLTINNAVNLHHPAYFE